MSKNSDHIEAGLEELRAARRESRQLYLAVGLFSAFANLLMLTGPLYMLQVYDRVLSSRSVETLVALTVLVAFLYSVMGILDFTRGRVLARIGARFQRRLDRRVFNAVIANTTRGQADRAQTGLADLESIQRFIASPAPTAAFDIPWTPVFLIGIAIFHPWLGYLAVVGGVILIGLTLLNQTLSTQPLNRSNITAHRASHLGEQLRSEAEMVQSLGMQQNAFERWQARRRLALTEQLDATDIGGRFTALTKTFRLFLQSAMLGLGALLVLRGELSPGAMIAGSILMGRALAPIELAIGQWPVFQRARKGWDNLAKLLTDTPEIAPRTDLPVPAARLEAQSLTVIPPGQAQASLRMVNFAIEPGEAVGVIGPSGAGKSTLARAITGTWRAAGGKVRLDRAALDQYEPAKLGEYIGYLPQRVHLFDGTIAENIARLSQAPDDAKIVKAAQQADAHDMILKLPDGYDTLVSSTGGRLSGGQIQRIGLARALYSEPVLLVLDEPNSNLDNDGAEALNATIRRMKAEGNSVIIMAHRPAAIRECDKLLVLKNGIVDAFGPRDEVLRKTVSNHQTIQNAQNAGGVQ
ncbi:type I secretion system permease/ATPase [Cognatishimia maritima]|uniref:ATP-binding cassette, subfamily C n=1 Tax=Cognatishimia maritima TaxID=870908 RepID=A0A1M5NLJ5_9RHOB|nr:type I secretion system permease/ATPase [Cognatishimia maritima]SHG90315.1 ATP-binding cassette, subfamily C [Cognatishimia maritima]